ncbi:hypothetical protein DEA8626_03825 [Defluviimonas aquaemixtae]|uniref:Beta-barrel assembly machine subunit BamF n=1 Tax=Albidovulum aquaemixtae TaxID=1542388 RepID=A0A2R8BN45_9RHOB|nr:DUF3035 domain-containing protein [Defluviimonas aquaemixtae]SPH24788.1 hypothetical protein DEA8626_03825 [Defluviimonas aquaemixtae]
MAAKRRSRAVLVRGVLLGAALMLSACGGRGKDPTLMNVRSASRSPDEFAILPTKPLQLPEDLASLPNPTPGGANITDPTPEADAVAALGGNPARLGPTTIAAGNGGLVSYAARFGTSADIRGVLAAEDLEYRRDNDGRLLERLANVNVYYRAYAPMSLDQYAELERWRRVGAKTVGAPPEEVFTGN